MDLRELAVSTPHSSRHPWETSRLEVVWKLMEPVFRDLGREIGILDVGSGDACVINALAHRLPGARCLAVDIFYSEEDLADLRERYPRVEFFTQVEEALSLVEEVHLVTLLDVIEHVEDDRGLLSGLVGHKKIHSGTRFLITVPAFEDLFTTHDVFMGHFRRYTNGSLKKVLAESGLSPVQTGYFFFSLLMPRLLKAIREKKRTPPEKPPRESDLTAWKGGRFSAAVIKRILLVDFYVGRIFRKVGLNLPGLSNFSLCRPSV
jgi:trans-aconitate methyltransferase